MREHVEEPRYVTTDDDTVYSLLSKRAARTPDDIIAEWQDDNTHQWRSATATEMLSRVREVAKGLLGLGVKAGTMVLIYSPTCYEWGVADFACAAIGAVVVPVYETDSARQTAGIVEEVDPAIAFAGDFQPDAVAVLVVGEAYRSRVCGRVCFGDLFVGGNRWHDAGFRVGETFGGA